MNLLKLASTVVFYMVIIQSKVLGLNPIKEYIYLPEDYGISYEQKIIRTPDNCLINSWICTNNEKKVKGTIVFLYGDSGNMSYFLNDIKKLTSHGFRVITFDYRGFGHSSIFQIEANQLFYSEFITDFNAALEVVMEKYSNQFIGVYSISMGTIVAAKSHLVNQLSFLICDSPVLDDSIIVERLKKLRGRFVVSEKPNSINEQDWKLITIPILLLVSSSDQITTSMDGLKLKNMFQKREIILYDCNHAQFLTCLDANGKFILIQLFINNSI